VRNLPLSLNDRGLGLGWEQVLKRGALSGWSRLPRSPVAPSDVQKRFDHPGNGITYEFYVQNYCLMNTTLGLANTPY
jgi:hypothetical protein